MRMRLIEKLSLIEVILSRHACNERHHDKADRTSVSQIIYPLQCSIRCGLYIYARLMTIKYDILSNWVHL